MNPTEPIWKSYICETTGSIFTPKQCQLIIDKGMSLKKETASVGIIRLSLWLRDYIRHPYWLQAFVLRH